MTGRDGGGRRQARRGACCVSFLNDNGYVGAVPSGLSRLVKMKVSPGQRPSWFCPFPGSSKLSENL